MSKAKQFSNEILAAIEDNEQLGKGRPTFHSYGYIYHVTNHGHLKSPALAQSIKPEDALRLGRWLVDQFGETDKKLSVDINVKVDAVNLPRYAQLVTYLDREKTAMEDSCMEKCRDGAWVKFEDVLSMVR